MMWGVVVIIALAVGTFFYVSRPLAAPSTDSTKPSDSTSVTAQPGETVFEIDNTQSSAKYEIDETLNGNPVHVVGLTKDIKGQIVLNTTNPAESKIGPISINARTFKTDNERRDNTVGRMILKSEEAANEFIVFTPVKMVDIPKKIEDGKKFPFSIIGNVSIAGVTQEVAFNGEATKTGNILVGTTESVINYADFGLVIPKLPFLAWVDNKVAISMNFVANAR